MTTKSTKTTKKSTKTAATHTAKRPAAAKKTAGRAASKQTACRACKIDETSAIHRCFCAVLCICCAVMALINGALFIALKTSNDALAQSLRTDRNQPQVEFEEEETHE